MIISIIRNIWRGASNLGIVHLSDASGIKRARFINRLALSGMACASTMFPILLTQPVYNGFWEAIGLFISCLMVLFFSSRGMFTLSASLLTCTFIVIMVYGATAAPNFGLEYSMLLITAFGFNMFKRHRYAIGIILLAFASFWVIKYLQGFTIITALQGEEWVQFTIVNILIFATLFLNGYYSRKEHDSYERRLLAEKQKLEAEKNRSEALLLNILPAETAKELIENGEATAKQYRLATVLFADFSGFTRIAEQMSASELVDELHHCFMHFDQIVEAYGVEKIKTIGDAYMCAGGLPKANSTNPREVVEVGLQMQKFMRAYKARRIAEGRTFFEVRIGIHVGPVVAGIVGVKKFAYDIWGDTVNVASRMESSGKVGRVNISADTYQMVMDQEEFAFEHRGKIQAKGKGELNMYFVDYAAKE